MRLLLTCLFYIFTLATVSAQDSIAKKMKWYELAKPSTSLFVHFDKNVYTNNETIWFTAYFIKSDLINYNQFRSMSVVLVMDADSSIKAQDKFLVQEGIAFGNLVIPDSLSTGNYHILAYADKFIDNQPAAVFIQPVTIKTNIDPNFKSDVKLLDTTNLNVKTYNLLVSVSSKDNLLLPKPTLVSYKYGNSYKSASTDGMGQLLITLPKQNNLADPTIYLKLKYNRDSSFIHMALPQGKSKASVKFYPEGGNLVSGLPSTIGWEVKDQQKRPMALKAVLYQDSKILDTITTNDYGIGKFALTPIINSTYHVKLIHASLIDSTYSLPPAIQKGLTLTVANAMVQDTLAIELNTNNNHTFFLRLHNFKEQFLYLPFEMGSELQSIKLPLTTVPKGLTTITVTDSLDRPLAERIFFAHYDTAEKISLMTDKQQYGQREKVNLKLKLNGLDEKGLVSIACVQDNRLELKKITDIVSYTYLNSELGNLPVNFKGNAYQDQAYLAQILLVKGWTRYTWQDLAAIKATDTIHYLDSLGIRGTITHFNKPLSKAKVVGSMGALKFGLFTTTANGILNLTNTDIIAAAGKKVYLFVNDKHQEDYHININDSYLSKNLTLARSIVFENPIIPSPLPNNSILTLKKDEKTIRLKEILISNHNNLHYGSNACGDYVCRYNILNCPNHIGEWDNTQPIAGKGYTLNGVSIIYQKCDEVNYKTFFALKAVHLQKEFYLNDYKDPQEPAFFSTLYWNYATVLTDKKQTELSFYTSDIKGKFRIVVQGVSNKDLIYGDQFFEVK